MTKIIDNSNEKMASALNEEITSVNNVAIASAYFNVRGFSLLRNSLSEKPLKLLLGREPDSNMAYQDELLSKLETEVVENEDDTGFFAEVRDAIDYFERKAEVRIVKDGFFHGKAYMGASPSLSSVRNGFAVTGSSNFTYGGLRSNRELNMLTTDREAVEELSRWFSGIWNQSEDFKENFLSFLRNYVTAHSPFEIVAKALYETLKDSLDEASNVLTVNGLYPHQKLSVSQAWDIVSRYGGVVLADPVGLGKTRVGISLAYMAINHGMKPMVIAPKSILENTWKNEMDSVLGMHIPSINTEMVSADPDILQKEFNDKDFIIIDEAHYFRSSASRRFSGLAEHLSRKDRKIVLVTATPVNNSLMDLYNLLTLFVNDDEVPDISPSLKGFFIEQQKKLLNGEKINIDPLLKKFVVRISRDTAIKLSRNLRFPSREIDVDGTSYLLSPSPDIIAGYIERLELPYYELAVDKQVRELTLPDGSVMSAAKQVSGKEMLKDLVRNIIKYNYFKRFESSIYSLGESLRRQIGYIEMTMSVLERTGKFIPPKFKRKVQSDGDGFDLTGIPPEQLDSLALTDQEKKDYLERAEEDRKILNSLHALVAKDVDGKFNVFVKKLQGLSIDGNNGVIIFTSFADTASYLYSRMKDFVDGSKLMIITGERAEGHGLGDRNDIIRHFMSSGGFLVSTDVLSAGQNLQNAQFVINYDLPWNPVILIQRTGRIDRIGSPYDRIYVMNFSPDNRNRDDPSSLEHFISLMGKLTSKIEGIRQGIGSDESILGEEPMPKNFNVLLEIIRGNSGELDKIEEMGKSMGIISWENPLDIYERIKEQLGEDKIRAIPSGSGAYKTYSKNGIFVLYRYEENKERKYRWTLKFDDDDKAITDESQIIRLLLQEPNDESGQIINYEALKNDFSGVRDALIRFLEKTTEKTIRPMSKDLREIIRYIQGSPSTMKYMPILTRREGDVNLIRTLKKAFREGRIDEKLEELLSDKSQEEYSDLAVSSPQNIHRVVWCLLRKSDNERGTTGDLVVQSTF